MRIPDELGEVCEGCGNPALSGDSGVPLCDACAKLEKEERLTARAIFALVALALLIMALYAASIFLAASAGNVPPP